MVDYVLEGPKWGGGALGTSGGTVTWAVDSTIPSYFLSYIAAALSDWSQYGNVLFQQVASTSTADIDFTLGSIDGLDNVLAQTGYSFQGSSFVQAQVEFDSGEGWHPSASGVVSNDNINFFVVALHEIGHALGLGHYNAAPAVMNADLNRSVTDLQQSDIDGIQAIYGASHLAPAGGVNLMWRNADNGTIVEWSFTHGQLTIASLGTAPTFNQLVDSHADYNGDGRPDLLFRDAADGSATVWQMSGTAALQTQTFTQIPASVHILNGHGDFDGDGKSDILWQSGSQLVDWSMNGTQLSSNQVIVAISPTADIMDAVGDYNNDGKTDLLVHDRDSGRTLDLQMNGATVAGVGDFGNIPTYISIVDGHADLNGDGKSDILWRDHSTGTVVEWLMNGTGISSVQALYAVPNYLTIVDASGDYNGDGTTDVLWRNTQSGEVVEWLMKNGQVASTQSLGVVPTSFTILSGDTDFNGDGTSDILWRDGASGRTVVWEMKQGGIAQIDDYGTIPTSISIVAPSSSGATITPDASGSYYGTVGNNTFQLNAHASTFTGGSGANTFVVETASAVNTVADFKPNIDQFQFDHSVFTNLTPGTLASSQFVANNAGTVAAGAATGDYIVENTSSGMVSLDHHVQNGSDTASQLVQLQNHAVLSNHDFLVI